MWTWLLVTSTVPLGAALAATIENPTVKKPLPTRISRCHLARYRCGAQVQCRGNGRMFADFASHQTPMSNGKYDNTGRFLFSIVPWDFVKKIKAVIMRYGCISHLRTPAGSMHRKINMISAYTSKKGPLRTNATKEEAEPHEEQSDHSHSSSSSTHDRYADVHNNGTPRSSPNGLMRPRHPLFFCSRGSVVSFSLHHVTLHVTLHLLICLVILKKEQGENNHHSTSANILRESDKVKNITKARV